MANAKPNIDPKTFLTNFPGEPDEARKVLSQIQGTPGQHAIYPPVRVVVVTYEELHKNDRVIDEARFNLYDTQGNEYCRVCAEPVAGSGIEHYCSKTCARHFYEYFTWKGVRERYRREHHHHCERCGRPANQVHHKVPLAWGGPLLDDRNLELLCDEHHAGLHRFIRKMQNPNRAPRPSQNREHQKAGDG